MDKNKYRYQLYMKRAVLQAHITAIDETILQIENSSQTCHLTVTDYRMTEDECFPKYLKRAEETD